MPELGTGFVSGYLYQPADRPIQLRHVRGGLSCMVVPLFQRFVSLVSRETRGQAIAQVTALGVRMS